MRQVIHRFCGIEISGPRSQRTSLVFLDYYTTQRKLFLVDIFDQIREEETKHPDAIVLEILKEFEMHPTSYGVGSPVDLPPCVPCTVSPCPTVDNCRVDSVNWMRKHSKNPLPYLQRPAEVYWKKQIDHPLQVHEALGANRAPLTARLRYLLKHFPKGDVIETDPRLVLDRLKETIHLSKTEIKHSRDVESGILHRTKIIEKLSKHTGMFIYQRDMPKVCRNLSNFDAFLIAFATFLAKHELCDQAPKDFPSRQSWIWLPSKDLEFRDLISP